MKRQLIGGLLAAMLLVGVMAPVATAGVNGAGVFNGTAEVGKWFTQNQPCTKDGTGDPEGEGLYFPLLDEDPINVVDRRAEGVWQFGTSFQMVGTENGVPGVFSGTFNVCGRLESMVDAGGLEIGAACGPSKGFEGKGRADENTGAFSLKLFDLGWKAVAGGIIPITGSYQEYTDAEGTKGKKGSVYALVNALPANENEFVACSGLVTDNGAKDFLVVGVFDLLNSYTDKGKGSPDSVLPEPPRDNGKQCKADGPKSKSGPKPSSSSDNCKGPGPQKPKP